MSVPESDAVVSEGIIIGSGGDGSGCDSLQQVSPFRRSGTLDEDATLSSLKELVAAGDHILEPILDTIADAARLLTDASGAALAMWKDGAMVCVRAVAKRLRRSAQSWMRRQESQESVCVPAPCNIARMPRKIRASIRKPAAAGACARLPSCRSWARSRAHARPTEFSWFFHSTGSLFRESYCYSSATSIAGRTGAGHRRTGGRIVRHADASDGEISRPILSRILFLRLTSGNPRVCCRRRIGFGTWASRSWEFGRGR